MLFVGAGVSRLVGAPSWDQFADRVVNQLSPATLNHHERKLVSDINDPRKRLSIAKAISESKGRPLDYKKALSFDPGPSRIYDYLNQLTCSFVTTNYDKNIAPEISQTMPEHEWRFYKQQDLLASKLDQPGSVVHLHGCVDDPKRMVVTVGDYLEHYTREEIPYFLKTLFDQKTVLFLGYGLEEDEILEYVLNKQDTKTSQNAFHLFVLQGFFQAEESLATHLELYYEKYFNAKLICYPRDWEDYNQLTEIIAKWAQELEFAGPNVYQEQQSLLRELGDHNVKPK